LVAIAGVLYIVLALRRARLRARRSRASARPTETATRETLTRGPQRLQLSGSRAEHAEAVWSVALSTDSRWGASGSLDNEVCLWDVAAGLQPRRLGSHAAPVMAVALAANTRTLLSASSEGVLRLWDLATETAVR